MNSYYGLINRYKEFLPVTEQTPVITLQEGNTPLLRSRYLSRELELDLFFKYEGLNPTGSFKDRGMTVAISRAKEANALAVICASTGNTSASAAAYAAVAGLKCIVLIPEGKIAAGKLAQALIHGALVLAVDGNFDQALTLVRQLTEKHPIRLVNSLNPDRIEGQKTAAFEVCDQLGAAPEYLAIPVGNAGNISAYWQGFVEYQNHGFISQLPKMLGFQAAGAAPLVKGEAIANPETVATAIRIGRPVRGEQALAAAKSSGGWFTAVTDKEILAAYQLLAAKEGLFVEPASAAGVAGLIKLKAEKKLPAGAQVVCVLTGHGLKDPGSVELINNKVKKIPAQLEVAEELIFSALAND